MNIGILKEVRHYGLLRHFIPRNDEGEAIRKGENKAPATLSLRENLKNFRGNL